MNYQNPYRPQNFSVLPTVVKNLLIINVLFFIATFIAQQQGVNLMTILGLHFPLSPLFRPYQIVTYMFMHGDFWHLFFNMFALWMFGNTLENLWGPKRFLIYYMITGIGAAICHYSVVYFQMYDSLAALNDYIANPSLSAFNNFGLVTVDGLPITSEKLLGIYSSPEALQQSVDLIRSYKLMLLNEPLVVGASGAVFGILLAFGVLFPNTKLYLYMAIPVKAKWFVLGYGLIELFAGIRGAASDNVAHFAHLGGMLFGFILLKYWQKQKNQFY
ncbi:MAG TPA: rhomboid family intramembrane serine protease [Bacteroidia bacterium]|jgi:membrane associated rhomboid family serine protease|nr:rhomboid family intramembrane serine protease [Bacteroidia bacterium]